MFRSRRSCVINQLQILGCRSKGVSYDGCTPVRELYPEGMHLLKLCNQIFIQETEVLG